MENTNEIREKRLEVLNDTISHFNSNNRSLKPSNSDCCYTALTSNTEGCAIGRLIADKDLCVHLDAIDGNQGGSGVSNGIVFNQLPDNLKELGAYFLTALQNLHDNPSHWNETGLTEQGKAEVNRIKTKFIVEETCINQ